MKLSCLLVLSLLFGGCQTYNSSTPINITNLKESIPNVRKLQDATVLTTIFGSLQNINGTAVVVYQNDSYAYLITDRHVTMDADSKPVDSLYIYTSEQIGERNVNNTPYLVDVVQRSDYALDLAILRYDVKKNGRLKQTIPLQRQNPIPVGSKIYHCGCPYGNPVGVSAGYIYNYQMTATRTYIRSDIFMDHGSSGGGIYDFEGNFIGISQYIERNRLGGFLYINDITNWINTTDYSFLLVPN